MMEVKFPYNPVCPSVSRLVSQSVCLLYGWSVCLYFQKGREVSIEKVSTIHTQWKFHFHALIEKTEGVRELYDKCSNRRMEM